MTTSDVFFAFIRDEIFGIPLNVDDGFVFNETALYRIAKKHDLAHILAGVIERNGIQIEDEGLLKEINRERKNAVAREMRAETAGALVSKTLSAAGIDHVFLKGSVIRELYPEPYMRTSCDIDVLVRETDIDRATSALKENGFEINGEKNYHDVSLFFGKIHLELHFNVLEDLAQTDGLLAKIWEHTLFVGGREYRETNEFFAFHHIAHAAYHILNGGCGIRPFIDLKLMQNKHFFDDNGLIALLNDCGLTDFYMAMSELAEVWFGSGEYTEKTERLARFVIKGGVYGSASNAVYVDMAQKQKTTIRYKLSLAFLPYDNMCKIYPSLCGRKILLPFYYVHRLFSKIFGKDNIRAKVRIKAIDRGKDGAIREAELLIKELGLKSDR